MQTNTGNAIGFRASLGKSTRANVTTLQNLSKFYVTAIGNNANYFTRMEVTSQDNGTTWQTAQTYYWPSYDLEFFATNTRSMDVKSTGEIIAGFQPTQPQAPVGDAQYLPQTDLVVAYNTGNKAPTKVRASR